MSTDNQTINWVKEPNYIAVPIYEFKLSDQLKIFS
jgi:hypothetical protein